MNSVIKYQEFGLTAFVSLNVHGYFVSLRDDDFDLIDNIFCPDLASAVHAAKSGLRSGDFDEFLTSSY